MQSIFQLCCHTLSAEIDLSHGAKCTRLTECTSGAEILRYEKNAPPDSLLHGIPLLFPPNRISGGRFTFEGREYRFPINDIETGSFIHGEMNRTVFSPEKSTEQYLSSIYRATKEQPYLQFPHSFTMRIEYEVTADSLIQTLRITNDSEENMPCGVGFHTTFSVPFVSDSEPENVTVQVDLSEEYERDKHYLPTGKIINSDPLTEQLRHGTLPACGQQFSRHYKSGNIGAMTLTDRTRGLQMVYLPDPKLKYRLIYNGDASGYICLEPQSWLTNSPNSPFGRETTGFGFLIPNETITYRSEIQLRKI